MKFSLVIPCYNEAKNLPLLLERCRNVALENEREIIIVDNGSTDNTPAILKELLPSYAGFRTVRVPMNQGYGFGILSGLREAKGSVLAWTHADMQTDPQDALEGLKLFDSHGPHLFVKGRRHGRPVSDSLFTVGMSLFETLLLGKIMSDINAQPTMFSADLFKTWGAPPSDFSLDLYAYYMAMRAHLPIHRFPVRFGERRHGVSHWNINWRAKIKFISRTITYSLELRKKLRKTAVGP